MRKVIGTLLRPDQSPVTPAQLVFRAVTTSLSGVPQGADAKAMLSESGAYDVDLVEGTYAVTLFTATAPGALGTVIVTDGPDITLPELLQVQAIPYSIAADLLDRVIELENLPPGSGLAGVDPAPASASRTPSQAAPWWQTPIAAARHWPRTSGRMIRIRASIQPAPQ